MNIILVQVCSRFLLRLSAVSKLEEDSSVIRVLSPESEVGKEVLHKWPLAKVIDEVLAIVSQPPQIAHFHEKMAEGRLLAVDAWR